MKYRALVFGAVALFISAQASASLITFENANTSAHNNLGDDDSVTTEWQGTDGVTFHGAYLEAAGSGGTDSAMQGFRVGNGGSTYDVPGSGTYDKPLGDWFLRTAGDINNRDSSNSVFLSITYDDLVTGASGQIWDIDAGSRGNEQWMVNAIDTSTGTIVATDTSPVGTSGSDPLNALPWVFSLDVAAGDAFDKIEFVFTGTKNQFIGLAFDNFNATSADFNQVPAPAAIGLFGFGILCLGAGLAIRRRRGAMTAAS